MADVPTITFDTEPSRYRHWALTEGRTHAKAARVAPAGGRSFLKVPLWMWRRAAVSARDVAVCLGRAKQGLRFQAELQIIEFWGYFSTLTLNVAERYKDRTAFK